MRTNEEALLDNSTSQNENNSNFETGEEGTFFDTEKSQNSDSGFELRYPNGSPQTVNIDELEIHPINRSLYPYIDENRIKLLAEDIRENSLYMKMIVNRNLQILSGNLRFKALQLLKVTSLEVIVVEIESDRETEFIISSNNHRIKNIFDQRNEIMTLWEKYSPGQGNRDTENEDEERTERRNTVKKISLITGYSTSWISNIRKVESTYSKFFEEIYRGNLTLNGALKKCEVIDALKNLGEQIDKLEVGTIDDKLESTMMSYCKTDYQDYYKMMESGKMNPMDAYKKVIGNKKRITKKNGESGTNQGKTGELDDTTYCPCCSNKVEVEKDVKWIKEYQHQIHQFVLQLRF